MQSRIDSGDDYSHYRFEYEEHQNHLHIEGILGKEEWSNGSRAPDGDERGPKRQHKKQIDLIHEKVENKPPLTRMETVENLAGLFSTELKAYKVRGVKAASRQ